MSDHGRIYKTEDGRHVPEGHEDAAFLAFSAFDALPPKVAAELDEADKPKVKKQVAPVTKQHTPADK